MYEKNPADKKKFNQKKLKIGYKLQTNLDKNKFGLVKKKAYICFVIKSRWFGEEKIELCPTPPSTYTNIIPHTQRNITKRDVGKKPRPHTLICFTHLRTKTLNPTYTKKRVISAFIARKN